MTERKKVPAHVKDALHRQAVRGQVRQPDLAKLVAHYFEVAGGEREIARMLYEEYLSGAPGGVVRQRILDLILRMTRVINDKTGSADDTGQMSEDDLDRELANLIETAASEAPDGPEQAKCAEPTREEAGPDPHGPDSALAQPPPGPDPAAAAPAADAATPRESEPLGPGAAPGTETAPAPG